MRLLVSGSRVGRADVWTALDAYLECLGEPELVIAGGARGVDVQAAAWARSRGLPLREVPVSDDDWATLGDSAGHARNAVMVDLCHPGDHLVAFPVGRSPGTRGCIALARKRGLQCFVLDLKLPYVFVPGVGELFLQEG